MGVKGGEALKELAQLALDTATQQGAIYADIRIIHTGYETIKTRNGRIGSIDKSEDLGFGVRVIANGAWGFGCSAEVNKEEMERVSVQAVQVAKASATLKGGDVKLAPVGKYVDAWKTPHIEDPFKIPLERKLGLLFEIDEILRRVKGVMVAETQMSFKNEHQVFASTEGSCIEQDLMRSGVGYSATAVAEGDMQKRSYPTSFDGQYESKGYELIEGLPLVENAQRVAEEAVALLSAPQCPAGEKDLILGGDQLALQIHESCGHPVELDRVLGTEANYAGTSFLTIDKLGKLRYGSPMVNLVADSTSPGGLGTFGYDDEGVPAQRWDIVKDGIFVGCLTSRETAHLIGQDRSKGTMRANGWNRIPLIRMSNLSLMPGEWTLEDLIADTKDGILMESNRSWSIDQMRLNFQFGTEIGWEIKNGKKVRMLKNPTYQGITTEFWNSCNAICNQDHWVLWGIPNCGKGQPGQVAETSHGTAPAKFRKVKVGVGYA